MTKNTTESLAPSIKPKTQRGRRPAIEARYDDKRTEILRVAAELFATRGYEATSLDMIASQIGMHKATLYHYVQGKESILYECLVKSFENLDTVIEKTSDQSVPVKERLVYFVQSLAEAQNNEFGRCLLLVGSRPLEMGPSREIKNFQRKLDHTVRQLIEEGIRTGVIRPCNPALFSSILFGALNWVPRWYKEDAGLGLKEIVGAYIDMLLNGVASTPETTPEHVLASERKKAR